MRAARALLCLFLSVPLLAAAQSCKLLRVAEWPIRNNGYQALLDGSINGKKIAILVDTGAFKSMLLRPAAIRLGLELTDITGARIRGVGGTSQAQYAEIGELRIGEASRSNWQILVACERDLGNNIAMILGDDFFERIDLELDFPKNVMRLFQPEDCGNKSLAYWVTQGAGVVDLDPGAQIRFDVKLNGRTTRVMLDTGASHSAIDISVGAFLGLRPGEAGVEPAGCTFGVGSNIVDQYVARFDTFTIGNETVRDPRLQMLEIWGRGSSFRLRTGTRLTAQGDLPEMLLGFDFLKTHRVFVSRTQRKMYFTHEGGLVFPSVSGKGCEGTTPKETTDAKIARYDAVIAKDPRDVQALMARGDAWRSKRDTKRALADFEAALAIEPANASALWSRGGLHHELGNYDLAIADYSAAISGGAWEARIYVARGNVWRSKGDGARALADYDQALKLDPSNANARFDRAAYYLQQGDDEKAAPDLEEFLKRNSAGKPIWYSRGHAFYRAGRFEAAGKDFLMAMNDSPTPMHAIWLYLALARGGAPNPMASAEESMAKLPGADWPEPILRFYAGKLDEAQLFAVAQHPDATKRREQECEANYFVAQRRLLSGDNEGARELLKKAVADCPRNFNEYIAARAELPRIK